MPEHQTPQAAFLAYQQNRSELLAAQNAQLGAAGEIDEAQLVEASGQDLAMLRMGAAVVRQQVLEELAAASAFLSRTKVADPAGSTAMGETVISAHTVAFVEMAPSRRLPTPNRLEHRSRHGLAGLIEIARQIDQTLELDYPELRSMIRTIYAGSEHPVDTIQTLVNPLIQIGVIELVKYRGATHYALLPPAERELAPRKHRISPKRVYLNTEEALLLAAQFVRLEEELAEEGLPILDESIIAALDAAPPQSGRVSDKSLTEIRHEAAEKAERLVNSPKLRWALSTSLEVSDPRHGIIHYFTDIYNYSLSLRSGRASALRLWKGLAQRAPGPTRFTETRATARGAGPVITDVQFDRGDNR